MGGWITNGLNGLLVLLLRARCGAVDTARSEAPGSESFALEAARPSQSAGDSFKLSSPLRGITPSPHVRAGSTAGNKHASAVPT